jgi:hypothetical protein
MPTVLPRRPPDPMADRLADVEPLADGLARLLDDLHERLAGGELDADARAHAIRRFVGGLDRARRLRLAGALHLLSDELEGGAVVGA